MGHDETLRAGEEALGGSRGSRGCLRGAADFIIIRSNEAASEKRRTECVDHLTERVYGGSCEQ
jgi:hypothetical protein